MLELRQGNKYKLVYSIKNADGSPKDLSGSLQLKYELSRAKHYPANIQLTLGSGVEITDPVNGKVEIIIEAALLSGLREGRYYHEMWQVNALGDPTTLLQEHVQIYSSLIKE